MKVLDTDILAALLRKKEEAMRKFKEMDESGEMCLTTVFNAQELLFGASISENHEENLKVSRELVESLEILAYDKDGMQQSVKVQIHLNRKGERVGMLDEMIAGIVLAKDATFVTRNVKHFSRIPNIKLERW